MSGNNRNRRGGFTLIELLVALTILTMIVGIIYGAYATVVDSILDTREASQTLRARKFIQRSLEFNLGQASEGWSPGAAYRAYSPPSSQGGSGGGPGRGVMRYPFLGAHQTTANGPADELTFVSSAPMIGGGGFPGGMKLCSYRITEDEEDDDETGEDEGRRMLLTISESPWIDPGLGHEQTFSGPAQANELVGRAAERAGIEGATVSVPVYAWELAYFDGKEWQDRWNSQEISRLPWAVRVRVKVDSPADDAYSRSSELDPEEDPRVFEFMVTVPIGAGIFDAPPDYARATDREAT